MTTLMFIGDVVVGGRYAIFHFAVDYHVLSSYHHCDSVISKANFAN